MREQWPKMRTRQARLMNGSDEVSTARLRWNVFQCMLWSLNQKLGSLRTIQSDPLAELVQLRILRSNKPTVSFSGLPISPKTQMINGIMLVILPQPFLQVSLWRCNLKGIDWLVVPGAWVPNPPNADGRTPMAFRWLGFGQLKAFWPNPRHQHLLGRDPWNSVGCSLGGPKFWSLWFIDILSHTHTGESWPENNICKGRLRYSAQHCQVTVPKLILLLLGSLGKVALLFTWLLAFCRHTLFSNLAIA